MYAASRTDEIRAQLEKDLKCRVIIIPEYHDELTVHADGLIRILITRIKIRVNIYLRYPGKDL